MPIIIPDPIVNVDLSELLLLRDQTTHFILENPESIVLNRPSTDDDGAGGIITSDPEPQPPQWFRIIEQNAAQSAEVQSIQGEMLRPSHVIIAEWDANIEEGDTFEWGGRTKEVAYIRPRRDYETWAEVKDVAGQVQA